MATGRALEAGSLKTSQNLRAQLRKSCRFSQPGLLVLDELGTGTLGMHNLQWVCRFPGFSLFPEMFCGRELLNRPTSSRTVGGQELETRIRKVSRFSQLALFLWMNRCTLTHSAEKKYDSVSFAIRLTFKQV